VAGGIFDASLTGRIERSCPFRLDAPMAIPTFTVFIESLLPALAAERDGLIAASAYEAVAVDLGVSPGCPERDTGTSNH
jgi:hypothetical protein